MGDQLTDEVDEVEYKRIAAALAQRISDGEFQPGDQLPSYAELAAHYKVGPHIARDAIKKLRIDGVARTRDGKGTFLVRRPGEPAPSEQTLISRLEQVLTRLDELEQRVGDLEQSKSQTKRARRPAQ